MYETLRIDREGHLTWLTLDRPAALNAMSRTLIRELGDFLWRLPEDRGRACSSCAARVAPSVPAST